jgi:hypothetical protein
MTIREQGWECPKCLRVWAPKIAACGACNARQTLPPAAATWGAPNWNFNGDDLSWADRPGREL